MSTASQEFDLLTWQQVLDSLPNPVALSRRKQDMNGHAYTEVVFINLAFKNTIGYNIEDIPTNFDWLHKAYPDPEYQAYIDQEWSRSIQKAKQSNRHVLGFSSKIRCHNGEDKWFQTTSHIAYPIFDEYDIVTFVEIETPENTILQLHSANQALLSNQTKLEISETKLQETQRIAQVGSWDIDLKTQSITWSEEMYRIFGREPSYTPNLEDFFEDLGSDQDRATIQNAIDNTIATGEKVRAEVKLIRHDGQNIYLEIFGQALFNELGEPISIVGSTMDITQNILIQNSLKNQYQLLEDIIDSVPARVFWINVDGVYQGGNNLFLQDAQIGSKEELIGKTDFDLPWGEGYASTYRSDDVEVMNSGDTKHLSEYEELDQNGNRVIWQSCRVALKDSTGVVTGLLCVYEDITERRLNEEVLHEQKDTLHHQAHHDDLTSLPNRALFQQRLNNAIIEGNKHNKPFALLFIDLDQFKQINDSLGHDVGDLVLQEVAERLQTHIRQEDCLARIGGDEFTILLNSFNSNQDVSLFTQRILENIKEAIQIDGHTFYLSCSIGISLYPNDSTSTEELLKFADTAMYRAKNQGRNNAQFYTNDMTIAAFEHVAMQSSLNQAIKNKEFIVFYQPKVNAKTNHVTGVEALVRWQHPTMGLVTPSQFVPIAEEMGLIVELDRLVMKQSALQMAEWRKQGVNPGVLSLNLSPKQLEQPDFMAFVMEILQETQCQPEWFELEVTENELMQNLDEMQTKLSEIQELGIQISIDDFGTGYSSLAYLKRLPISKLKIDKTFIKDIVDGGDDAVITKTIIMMAHNLGLDVIAEGVESIEQRDFLVANGCENIQGYLYAKPMPANKLVTYLNDKKPSRPARF